MKEPWLLTSFLVLSYPNSLSELKFLEKYKLFNKMTEKFYLKKS